MTRNQKIALGCGGAGCLGLIVVVIAAALMYFFAYRTPNGRNYNLTTNRNSSNSNLDDNSNANSDSNSNSSSTSSTTANSLSDDDKHKLYQAAAMTGDQELIRRVSVKIGLMDDDYTPGDNYQQFLADHITWVIRNREFIQSINSTDKARDYVNQHFPE
jgi:hypothetical protein